MAAQPGGIMRHVVNGEHVSVPDPLLNAVHVGDESAHLLRRVFIAATERGRHGIDAEQGEPLTDEIFGVLDDVEHRR